MEALWDFKFLRYRDPEFPLLTLFPSFGPCISGDNPLGQSLSTGDVSPIEDIWQYLEAFWLSQLGRRVFLASSGQKPGRLLTQDSLLQRRIFQPQMSRALGLGTPAVEKGGQAMHGLMLVKAIELTCFKDFLKSTINTKHSVCLLRKSKPSSLRLRP